MELGASFSHRHLKYLKLDPLVAIKEFKKLGLTWVRLGCYWNEIEKTPGKFSFSEVEPLVKFCEENKINVLLTVGIKAPRYPEYYIPVWLRNKLNLRRLSKIDKSSSFLLQRTLLYLDRVINHFKNYEAIKVWQVENEPMDPSGEKWWRIDPEFLKREVALVKKIDAKRKILINLWGNELTRRKVYKKAVVIGDIVGFDIYTRHPIQFFLFIKRYLGPLEPQEKIKEIVKEIKSAGKTFWITELQAEPWEPNEIITKKENPPSFLPKHFKSNFEYIKKLNPSVTLLWGFEYWYWRKSLGDKRYWKEAKKLIRNHL